MRGDQRGRTEDWRATNGDAHSARALHEQLARRKVMKRRAITGSAPPPDAIADPPQNWALAYFDDVCDDVTVGHVGPMVSEYRDEGIPFLRSQNVREFRFDPSGLKFVSEAFHQAHRKSALRPGDVAEVRSGFAGAACVIPDALPVANCADIVVIRPSAMLDPHFACVVINSAAARADIERRMVGIAQGHFNVGAMRVTPLALPPLAEQHEIVRQVEALFRLADAVEQRVAAAGARAGRLTQAILAKAFSGELVPTEAELARAEGRDYESAAQLLARIRAERAAEPAKGASRRRHGPGNGAAVRQAALAL